MLEPWRRLGFKMEDAEHAIFSMELQSLPQGFWKLADDKFDKCTLASTTFMEAVTALADRCWRIAVAVYLHSVWRWRANFFNELTNATMEHHKSSMTSKLRHGYPTVQFHLNLQLPAAVSQHATSLIRRTLMFDEIPYCPTAMTPQRPTSLLMEDLGENPAGGSGAIVVRTGEQLPAPFIRHKRKLKYSSLIRHEVHVGYSTMWLQTYLNPILINDNYRRYLGTQRLC
ncbi:unnamed protein product [Phytophthora lilii]|uniref:Unnamed protein product n=1 Tax=Phytophthora lilii TaxID=2077276 RepID=A0A9W6YKY1_9STRA|nr:unnamed protein product [Phytophthora lilii]